MNTNRAEKVCPCGRIITDPNSRTGLCPKCQKEACNVLTVICGSSLVLGIKRFAPEIAKVFKKK